MPSRSRTRYTTFLVAPATPRPGDAARAVYAVMAPDAAEAIAAVQAQAEPAADCAIVGTLSTKMAKALRLKPGQVQPV